jgi:hypothetical protein
MGVMNTAEIMNLPITTPAQIGEKAMIGHFPHPHPDELLYSVIARMRERYSSIESTWTTHSRDPNVVARKHVDAGDQ